MLTKDKSIENSNHPFCSGMN